MPVDADALMEELFTIDTTAGGSEAERRLACLEPIAKRAEYYTMMKEYESAALVMHKVTLTFITDLINYCEENGIKFDMDAEREASRHISKRLRREQAGEDGESSDDEDVDEYFTLVNNFRPILDMLEKNWTALATHYAAKAVSEREQASKSGEATTETKSTTSETQESTSDPALGEGAELELDYVPKTPLEIYTILAEWASQIEKFVGPAFSDAMRQCKVALNKLGIPLPKIAKRAQSGEKDEKDLSKQSSKSGGDSMKAKATKQDQSTVTVGPNGRPRKTLLKVE